MAGTGLSLTRASASRMSGYSTLTRRTSPLTVATAEYRFSEDRITGGTRVRHHTATAGAEHHASAAGFRECHVSASTVRVRHLVGDIARAQSGLDARAHAPHSGFDSRRPEPHQRIGHARSRHHVQGSRRRQGTLGHLCARADNGDWPGGRGEYTEPVRTCSVGLAPIADDHPGAGVLSK